MAKLTGGCPWQGVQPAAAPQEPVVSLCVWQALQSPRSVAMLPPVWLFPAISPERGEIGTPGEPAVRPAWQMPLSQTPPATTCGAVALLM